MVQSRAYGRSCIVLSFVRKGGSNEAVAGHGTGTGRILRNGFRCDKVINNQMKESAENLAIEQFAELKYSNKTNRLTVDLGRHTSITFTPAMRYMLGISHLRHPLRNSTSDTIQWTSAKSCDIHRGFTSMYVYCDVLE